MKRFSYIKREGFQKIGNEYSRIITIFKILQVRIFLLYQINTKNQ